MGAFLKQHPEKDPYVIFRLLKQTDVVRIRKSDRRADRRGGCGSAGLSLSAGWTAVSANALSLLSVDLLEAGIVDS